MESRQSVNPSEAELDCGGVAPERSPPNPFRFEATRGKLKKILRTFAYKNGSSQSQKLALTVLFAPESIGSGAPTGVLQREDLGFRASGSGLEVQGVRFRVRIENAGVGVWN